MNRSLFYKNILFTVCSKFGLMGIGLISSIIVARYLGPENNGKAILILNLPMVLFMTLNFGLGSAFSYFSANKEISLDLILGSAFWATLILSAFSILLYILLYPFHSYLWSDFPQRWIIFSLIFIPFVFLTNFLNRIIIGLNRITLSNNISIITNIIKLLSVFIFVVIFRYEIDGIIIANVIFYFLTAVFTIHSFKGLLNLPPINIKVWSKFLKYGIFIYAAMLISYLNLRIDIYLLKYITSDDKIVGFYSIAVSFAEIIWILPDSVSMVLFPNVASKSFNTKTQTIKVMSSSFIIICIGSLLIIGFGKVAILMVYGKQYLPSYHPLLYLLPGIMMYPFVRILGVDISARGNPSWMLVVNLVGLFVNLFFNFKLIPIYGAAGAAIASSISYTIMALFTIIFFYKTKLNYSPPKLTQ